MYKKGKKKDNKIEIQTFITTACLLNMFLSFCYQNTPTAAPLDAL